MARPASNSLPHSRSFSLWSTFLPHNPSSNVVPHLSCQRHANRPKPHRLTPQMWPRRNPTLVPRHTRRARTLESLVHAPVGRTLDHDGIHGIDQDSFCQFLCFSFVLDFPFSLPPIPLLPLTFAIVLLRAPLAFICHAPLHAWMLSSKILVRCGYRHPSQSSLRGLIRPVSHFLSHLFSPYA